MTVVDLFPTPRNLDRVGKLQVIQFLVAELAKDEMSQHTIVDDPFEQFIGAFPSNGSDWADNHDQYIGNALLKLLPY